jgi:hypothetical protein
VTLSKDDIGRVLETAEIRTKPVPVPELGGSVVVREMSGSLRNLFEATVAQMQQKNADSKLLDKLTTRLATECVLDGEGNRLFDDRTAKLLFLKVPSALFRLRDEIVAVSALSQEDYDGLVENFGDDPSEPSTSD